MEILKTDRMKEEILREAMPTEQNSNLETRQPLKDLEQISSPPRNSPSQERSEPTSGEKWGFSISQRLLSILVPNGWGKYKPTSSIRVSRIPALTEEMFGKAVDAAINQHNHYIIKLYSDIEKLKKEKIADAEKTAGNYKRMGFLKFREKEILEQHIVETEAQVVILNKVQKMMETISPDNVKVKDEKGEASNSL